MIKILIVEDDKLSGELVMEILRDEGFLPEWVRDGRTGMAQIRKQPPDLVILDLMLPSLSGLEILKEVRRDKSLAGLPVIVLSAKQEETDAVLALELGADDYVIKPFRPRELVARVRAHNRRLDEPAGAEKPIQVGELLLDPASFQVSRKGQAVVVSTLEFRLLYFLASHPGRVFSRERLLTEAWGKDRYVVERNVDTYMWRLRTKIEKDPANPVYLKTLRGAGYVFGYDEAASTKA